MVLPKNQLTMTSTSGHQCLLCPRTVHLHDNSLTNGNKLPVEQLHDVLKALRISAHSFDHIPSNDLPPKLFCSICGDYIEEAVHILWRVECLQKEFQGVKKILEGNFVRNWERKKRTGGTSVDQVRETLFQCFSPCKILATEYIIPNFSGPEGKIKGEDIKSKCEAKYSGGLPLDRHDGELTPEKEIVMRSFNDQPEEDCGVGTNNECDYPIGDVEMEVEVVSSQRLEEDVNITSSDSVNGQAQTLSTEKTFSFLCRHCGKGYVTKGCLSRHEKRHEGAKREKYDGKSVKAGRTFDGFGRLFSYDCEYCEQTISREDFSVGNCSYKFQCISTCCDKVFDNFGNLVKHHQGFCPSKPNTARSAYAKTISRLPISTKSNSSKEIRRMTKNREYDPKCKLLALNCPHCKRKLVKEDYKTAVGSYIFKCLPNCCDTIFSDFSHLVRHHEYNCPEFLSARKRAKIINTGNVLEEIVVSEGFRQDEEFRIIGFQCSRCQHEMSQIDFKTESGDFLYKCSWDSCGKIAPKFFNLVHHHEYHCLNKVRNLNQGSVEKPLRGSSLENIRGEGPGRTAGV